MARFRGLAVSAASRHTCAVGIDSLASCWGDNSRGQAGVGRASTTPIDVVTRVASDVKFQSIGASSGWGLSLVTGHSCAVSVAGRMYCWGNNTLGELGRATGDFTRPDTIVTPVGGSVRWKAVAAGGGMLLDEFLGPRPSAHTCGLTDRGAIYCWGGQEAGKLGNGSNNRGGTQVTPIRIAEP